MSAEPLPSEVGGYVLAGGKSSRMGREKALLPLAGEPLVRHAVSKLRRVCRDVRILSANPALAEFAPLVPDLHPECGPMGGMEAALTHSAFDWNLFYPVDMPFLPTAFLRQWVRSTLTAKPPLLRIALFTVEGVPQPTLAILHKEVLPFLSDAISRGQYKLYPVLQQAGAELARRQGALPGTVIRNMPSDDGDGTCNAIPHLYGPQQAARHLWFANLNTPEEFREAERHFLLLSEQA